MPFFSIITCSKNSAKLLKNNIESVRSQTFVDYEHVFIDGLSTDGTIEMIKEYQRSDPDRIRSFELEPNGISNAMNEGVRRATGKYIIHINSDDYLHDKDVLGDVHDFLIKDDWDWIYGKEVRKSVSGKTIFETNQSKLSRNSSDGLLGKILLKFHFYVKHQAVFIKRSIFERYGYFDEKLTYAMDYEYILRIMNTNWIFFDRKIDVFTVHSGNNSLNQENDLENSVELALIQRKYMNALEFSFKYLFDYIRFSQGIYYFLSKTKHQVDKRLKNKPLGS